QWYPEGARLTALQGATMLFYPTAIGWHPGEKAAHGAVQLDAWRTIQRGHAIANGVFVAAVNRVGHEGSLGGDGIEFWGSSFLADPFGVVIAEAPRDREAVLVADVDLGTIEDVRRGWQFPRAGFSSRSASNQDAFGSCGFPPIGAGPATSARCSSGGTVHGPRSPWPGSASTRGPSIPTGRRTIACRSWRPARFG